MQKLEVQQSTLVDLIDRLEGYRRDGGATFGAFLRQLNVVRSETIEMTDDLEKLGESCASAAEAGRVINGLAESAKELSDAMDQCRSAINPERLMREIWHAQSALDTLDKQSRRLSAVASFSAIAAASVSGDDMSHHVALLHKLSKSLKDDCGIVSTQLNNVQDAVHITSDYMAKGMIVLADLNRQLSEQIGASGHGDVLTKLSATTLHASTKMLQETQDHMRKLISHMQFSDAYSQRLEHVISIVGDEMPGGGPIATAQVRVLAEDQHEVQTDITQALCGLSEVCDRASATLGTAGFGPQADNAIEACSTALNVALRAGSMAEETVEEARQRLNTIDAACQMATQKFERLGDVLKDMDNSSINVSLRSRSAGDGHVVLRTLASEVHDIATETGQSFGEIARHMNSVSKLTQADVYTQLAVSLKNFKEIAADCTTLQAKVNSIRDNGEAVVVRGSKLLDAIRLTDKTIQPVNDITNQLEDEAANLKEWAEDHSPPSSDENKAIFDLYTMDRERVIHQAIYEISVEEPAVQSDDSLDEDDFEMF